MNNPLVTRWWIDMTCLDCDEEVEDERDGGEYAAPVSTGTFYRDVACFACGGWSLIVTKTLPVVP